MEGAAQRIGVSLIVAEARKPDEIEAAFDYLHARGAQALVVQQDPLFTGQRRYIVKLAEKHKLPAVYPFCTYVEAGGHNYPCL
jgi:putative tryptophan/tyrosine transport system substrate-binding protein